MDTAKVALVRPMVLLNVCDHSERRLKTSFGVLLGNSRNSEVRVMSSFELLVQDNLQVDLDFLETKLEQHSIVELESDIIGIYHIKKGLDPDSATVSVTEQILMKYKIKQDFFPFVWMIFDPPSTLINSRNIFENERFPIAAYSYNKFPVLLRLKVEKTELDEGVITTLNEKSSVFPKTRTSKEQHDGYRFEDDFKRLTSTLGILENRIADILEFYQNNQYLKKINDDEILYLNKLVVFLAKKLTLDDVNTDCLSKDLEVTRLSVLTSQLIAITNLETENTKCLYRMRKLEYLDEDQYQKFR